VGDLPAFGEWQDRGRVAAVSRHSMCELAFNKAGERQGMCESGFMHPILKTQYFHYQHPIQT
jgi:hypothetical protein